MQNDTGAIGSSQGSSLDAAGAGQHASSRSSRVSSHPSLNSRSRSWCFTANNYTPELLERIRGSVAQASSFLCFQPERGETGTPHLQGFIHFSNPRALGGLTKLFGRGVHFESMRGTVDQAIDYCSKEDSRDSDAGFAFEEFGIKPVGQGLRTDILRLANMVQEGKRMRDVADEAPDVYVKFHKGLAALSSLYQEKRAEPPSVYWFWGPTGTGKTRAAYSEAEAIGEVPYFKMSTNKWWDGYEGQAVVIIDDYRCDFSTFAELLRLLDRYPMKVETKGGTVEFIATHIYITTPKTPVDTWATRSVEDVAQLTRRITEIRHYPSTVIVIPSLFVNNFSPI